MASRVSRIVIGGRCDDTLFPRRERQAASETENSRYVPDRADEDASMRTTVGDGSAASAPFSVKVSLRAVDAIPMVSVELGVSLARRRGDDALPIRDQGRVSCFAPLVLDLREGLPARRALRLPRGLARPRERRP